MTKSPVLLVSLAILACAILNINARAMNDQGGSDCNCPIPLSWIPVCGTNNETYPNIQALNCHNTCSKTSVTVLHQGPCAGETDLFEEED